MAPHSNPIVLTEFDRDRLVRLIEAMRERPGGDTPNLEELEIEIERADVVKPGDIPPNVITMNSKVELVDLDTQEQLCMTVVFPGAADVKSGRISVLAPMGLALLGCRETEEVEWPTPSRTRRLRIQRIVYQPEASGRFDI
ncbi:nucleoside diphosphate kinase regulator [Sorangium cellulosum]|uniref:Nucleoside diphosphate kinase regulator n=1 Tax=Sorangium cellulosum TaxID=56 RepID=A0A4P2QCU6_SORCE|nr:nucleoside diphosphate kinase regulator [Sorangium cellulosum]AUX27489.1 nucleoside diphosphate kinase regulator [Sorangium cellulosum]